MVFWHNERTSMIVEVLPTLLCQLRSQTRPHSATIVGSVKVRFWQVATLTVYFQLLKFLHIHYLCSICRGFLATFFVVFTFIFFETRLARFSSTLLSKQALFRVSLPLLQVKVVSLPTKMYCMIRKGVNTWGSIRLTFTFTFQLLTLRKQRTATYLTCCLPDSPISRKTLSISMARHLGDLFSNCQVFVMFTMIITSSVQDIMEKCSPHKSAWCAQLQHFPQVSNISCSANSAALWQPLFVSLSCLLEPATQLVEYHHFYLALSVKRRVLQGPSCHFFLIFSLSLSLHAWTNESQLSASWWSTAPILPGSVCQDNINCCWSLQPS